MRGVFSVVGSLEPDSYKNQETTVLKYISVRDKTCLFILLY
jgi:hypothetical protein